MSNEICRMKKILESIAVKYGTDDYKDIPLFYLLGEMLDYLDDERDPETLMEAIEEYSEAYANLQRHLEKIGD